MTARRARLAGVALAAREAEGRMLHFGIGATAFAGRTVNLETRLAAVSHFLHSGPGAGEIAGLPVVDVSPDQTVWSSSVTV